MNIIINGEARQIPDNYSAADLVLYLEMQDVKIAMEINREIIPRSQYKEHPLKNGDKVEIVRAIGGG